MRAGESPIDRRTCKLTWPVSVSNLYNRIAGLFEPMFDFLGVTDGAIMIQLTGFPTIPLFA